MTLQGFYTNLGQALAAKVAAGSTALTITRVVAGSGHTADPASATSLPDIRQTLAVGSPTASGNTATLPVTLAEVQAGSPYSLTELGIYATDPDAGEILFQIYQLDTSAPITAGGENVLRFYLRQTIGAQGVTVTCSPAGIVLNSDLDPLRTALAHKPDAVLSYRALHVAKTGDDTTGDGSASRPFLTIQKAVDSLPKLVVDRADIIIHSGDYPEIVHVDNFSGGEFNLGGADGESVSVKAIRCERCKVQMRLHHLDLNGLIDDEYRGTILLVSCDMVLLEHVSSSHSVTQQHYGTIRAQFVGIVRLYDVAISNKSIAIDAAGSTIYMNQTVTGAGNTVGIRCGSGWGNVGGFVQKGGASIGGTEITGYGGQIW